MSDEDSYSEDDLYDDDENDDSYYNGHDPDVECEPTQDIEAFDYEQLDTLKVDSVLDSDVRKLSEAVKITPTQSKIILLQKEWNVAESVKRYQENPETLMQATRVLPDKPAQTAMTSQRAFICPVCMTSCGPEQVATLACNHRFCRTCWDQHFCMQILSGISTRIECMMHKCRILAPEDFVNSILQEPSCKDKYRTFSFQDCVKSHPSLRFCPGPNCQVIIYAENPQAKKVSCSSCNSQFCFMCGEAYHAPTACDTIKQWLSKCADDSETANYISANTKDCPMCNVCIEKNGGCNHMQCSKCHHDFCWMCLGDWKAHGGEYYECSRYKENPNIAHESANAQAREALKKYLFYFERWENHARSMKLEEETTRKVTNRIQEKVMKAEGTWIDWRYLNDAAELLKKCRYTLQYTYPYAYFMEFCPRKELFEYQQAQLEQEVENLSWKVERAEMTDRGDLENQMNVAEKRRVTLLKDFLNL